MTVVMCPRSELEEYGEVLAVGDHVRRRVGRNEGVFYGTDLDESEWAFDRYAEVVSGERRVMTGTIVAIAAVYGRFGDRGGSGEAERPTTVWVEPLRSTASTRPTVNRLVATAEDDVFLAWRVTLEGENRGHGTQGRRERLNHGLPVSWIRR